MEPPAGTAFWTTFATTSFLFLFLAERGAASIAVTGQRARCSNEGETIAVDGIDKQKCYSCICKNGLVECYHFQICPEIRGCHMLIDKTKDDCCVKCQGCYYNGAYHESYTEWTMPGKPCNILKCEAGVITKSEMQCHVPCSNPIPPTTGKCCPMCPDCMINGQVASDDRDVTSGDLCVKCRCKSGKMTCSKTACPVLQCAKENQQHDPSECCPKCRGVGSPLQAPRFCLLQKKVHKDGDAMVVDQCTRCKCVNQTSVCDRRTCPILDCPIDLQKKRSNGCCRECVPPEVEEVISQCTFNGETYKEGQSWALNSCTLCKCHGGRLSCAKTLCNTTLPCPYGTHLVHKEGECCDRCEELKSEAVCMAFGNAHYKTFDGKIFTFQGLGKYQLVSDCHNHSFSVRVTNDLSASSSSLANRTSTSTKRVRIKYGNVRINLGQKYKTRIDGTKVSIPYNLPGKLYIGKEEYNLLIELSIGVKIVWNGQGFLEVTVPAVYKSKLCGLCGNFNSNVQDDLRLRKGGIVNDTNLLKFGASWCVGKDCPRQAKRMSQLSVCKVKSQKRRTEKNPCKYLTSSELFNDCDSKLNYIKYYNACVRDMCDCPHGKCYCESLMAYAQECKRLGVSVKNWEKNSYCFGGLTVKLHSKQKFKSQTAARVYTSDDIVKLSQRLGKKKERGNKPMIH